jgi:hypothetical protein
MNRAAADLNIKTGSELRLGRCTELPVAAPAEQDFRPQSPATLPDQKTMRGQQLAGAEPDPVD